MNSEQRVECLRKGKQLNIEPLLPTDYAKGTNFWTICKERKIPIDPLDALEIETRDQQPWQDKEYLSIYSAIEPQTFSTTGEPFYEKQLKPMERNKLATIKRQY